VRKPGGLRELMMPGHENGRNIRYGLIATWVTGRCVPVSEGVWNAR
jgi:hypothetical protein